LHVISSGGLPLALFLLIRGYRRSSAPLVLAGWLVSAWQVSLGFTLGLQYCYLLAVLALLVLTHWWRAGALPWAPAASRSPESPRYWRSPRSPRSLLVPRRLLAVSCVGIAALGLVTVYQARPYLKVS